MTDSRPQTTKCTAYPFNGCAHPQFCREGCAGRPYTIERKGNLNRRVIWPQDGSYPIAEPWKEDQRE